ncbi:hypothetical protein [Microbacterium sp.]|uniref:hypothetical protein n=1 Tax=Microbacterium sp. TaxID=51671 RepID=UPI003C73A37B
MSDYLPDDAIGALVASASEPAVAARALVAAALRAVSRDKVTAVIADVVDGVNIRVSEHRGYWG